MVQSADKRPVMESTLYTKVKAILQSGVNVTVTPNDGAKTLAISSTGGGGGGDGFANVYMQPIWDGVGAHPTRPVGLPLAYFSIWRQPTAPLVGATYSKDGDEWEVTDSVG